MQIDPQSETATHPLEWLTLKRWIMSNVGKDIRQPELIHCCRNPKLYFINNVGFSFKV
jgi:hypothetical protein